MTQLISSLTLVIKKTQFKIDTEVLTLLFSSLSQAKDFVSQPVLFPDQNKQIAMGCFYFDLRLFLATFDQQFPQTVTPKVSAVRTKNGRNIDDIVSLTVTVKQFQ